MTDRMPLNSEALPSNSREEFCLALRAARERSGITLKQISDATKIPASLFAGLERNDLRHWPHGLFRRSFFRDYASMIGVPVAEACADFVRLFIDGESAELAPAMKAAPEITNVRLALDPAWHGPRASVRARLVAALIDGGVVVPVALVVAWGTGSGRSMTVALVALTYFSLATAVFGKSPASWAISRAKALHGTPFQALAAMTNLWQRLGGAADSTTEPEEGTDLRSWVSDARRVGPEPRLRVRVKVPQ